MKAIYNGCVLDPWLEVAEKLKNEHDIEPVLWIGWNKNGEEKIVKDKFPNIIFQDLADAWRGEFSEGVNIFDEAVLDGEFLKGNAFHEVMALRMMDRMDPTRRNFNFNERQRHYRRLLRKWLSTIDAIKPDLIVSPNIPHRIYDYALYVAAKSRGIKFLSYQITNISGFLIPMPDIYSLPPIAHEYKKNKLGYTDMSTRARERIDKTRQDYENAEPDYTKKNDQTTGFYKLTSLWKGFASSPSKHLNFLFNSFKKTGTCFKKKNKEIENSNFSFVEVEILRWRGRRYKRKLKKYYDSIAQRPDLDRKYILVALHYQPEATSTPSGSIYTDQYLMIDMISKSIPDDWVVYVKEHKTQFHPLSEGEAGREKSFYKDVLELENTQFVPLDYNIFDLIDNSQGVVTLIGTTGFEAIVRGKPVLAFGNAWYAPVQSVFAIKNKNDLGDAIKKIKEGIRINADDVCNYIAHLEKHAGLYAYHYKGEKEALEISKKQSVDLLAKSILDNLQGEKI